MMYYINNYHWFRVPTMFAGVDWNRTSEAGIFGVSMDNVVIPEVGSRLTQ